MARESTDKCSRCRAAGDKLFIKGDKCFGPKCPLIKRNYVPGVHGPDKRHSKKSVYGKQLFEKQKAKRLYGILERQFSNYVAEASKKTGDTSKFLINYLESRLDNVVFRMGLGKSRNAGRQIVGHGHVQVNGKKVNIPSYRVKVGDKISLSETALKKALFDKISDRLAKVELPEWLGVDAKSASARILNTPSTNAPGYNAKSIIEFYSR